MSTIPLLTVADMIWPSPLAVPSHRPTRSAIPSPPPPLPPSTTRGPISPPPPPPLLMAMMTMPVPSPITASPLAIRGSRNLPPIMVTEVGRVIPLEGALMKKKEEGVVMVVAGLSGPPPTGMVGDKRSLLVRPATTIIMLLLLLADPVTRTSMLLLLLAGPATRTSMLLLLLAGPAMRTSMLLLLLSSPATATSDRRNMMHLLLARPATNDRRSMDGLVTNDGTRKSIASPATGTGKRGRPLTTILTREENADPKMGMALTMKKRSIAITVITTTIVSTLMMSEGWRPLSKWLVWLGVPI